MRCLFCVFVLATLGLHTRCDAQERNARQNGFIEIVVESQAGNLAVVDGKLYFRCAGANWSLITRDCIAANSKSVTKFRTCR